MVPCLHTLLLCKFLLRGLATVSTCGPLAVLNSFGCVNDVLVVMSKYENHSHETFLMASN